MEADPTMWDEAVMVSQSSKEMQRMINANKDEEATMSETTSNASAHSATRIGMPSRWAQYEKDSEKLRKDAHEANCKAVEMEADKIANSPGRSVGIEATLPNDYESDEGSEDCGWENDEQIRAEAMRMLDIADTMSAPYNVRKTQSGGFSASYSGGFGAGRSRSSIGSASDRISSANNSRRSSSSASNTSTGKRVPSALAGLDFTKRASSSRSSYTPRSSYRDDEDYVMPSYAEEDNLVGPPKTESKWSSRYSIDHTLLALSGRRGTTDVKDVLNHMERETDREIRSARNMFVSSPHESSGIFGSSGFSFRDTHVFGKQNVTVPMDSRTNLKTAFQTEGLDSNGKSLTPPEPRKTWQEQLERKKKQQRRLIMVSVGLCVTVALLIGILLGRKSSSNDASAFGVATSDRGTPDVVFYVTSDSPYDSSAEEQLTADLAGLPKDAEFFVHLGNIQDSTVTLCSEARYARVADVLRQSPVTMFVLPGEEDWNNCPNPEDAWGAWETNFESFEQNFERKFEVSRQLRRKENFAFIYSDVLFMGFHLVGGRVNDQEESEARLADAVNWMESMVTMNGDRFKYIVMMGNARPSPHQRIFFDRLAAFLGPYDLPIIYVHANSGVGGLMQYDMFGDDYGIEGLQIEDGGQNPPLRISIYSDGKDGPFVVG